MRNPLHIALCIIFLTSGICSCSPRILTSKRDTVTQTKVEYIEKWRDTTIYVQLPSDSVAVSTFDTMSVLRIKTAISEAFVSNGTLSHKLYSNPSYEPKTTVKVADIETVRDSIVYVNVETPVEVERKLTKFQKFRMHCGDIMICLAIALALFLLWKLLRK